MPANCHGESRTVNPYAYHVPLKLEMWGSRQSTIGWPSASLMALVVVMLIVVEGCPVAPSPCILRVRGCPAVGNAQHDATEVDTTNAMAEVVIDSQAHVHSLPLHALQEAPRHNVHSLHCRSSYEPMNL